MSHVRHYIDYMHTAVTLGLKATLLIAFTSRDQWVAGAFDILKGLASSSNVPIVVIGQPADFEWDACSILTFTNNTHLKQFIAVLTDEEKAKTLAKDEERFMDRSRF
jgi:hypothetical protein